MRLFLSIAFLSLFTAGCKSSQSDTETAFARCEEPSSLKRIDTQSGFAFVTEQSYFVNNTASIIAQADSGSSQNLQFQWRQIAGPALTFSTTRSPVLAFTPTESGDYIFELAMLSNTQLVTETIEITVQAARQGKLNIQHDHQVTQGNDVSVRLERINNTVPDEISWCVAMGPDLALNIENIERPLFTAPSVTSDTISIIRASRIIDGQEYTDEVNILTTKEANITSAYFDSAVSRTFPYKASTPFAESLQACIYSNQLRESCTINRLPLIGQMDSGNTHDNIMDRVLVSHEWMGENFEAFLKHIEPNDDFTTLLQSVTAIVISYDVRPSFYWVVTGAIYLDPSKLWLTPEQRDSINEAPDYRSEFGKDLGFLMPWRYVKNNQAVAYYAAPYERNTRTLDQLTPDLASLLYHELAHANDFFPRSIHSELTDSTLLSAYQARRDNQGLISDQLSSLYPLQSDEMSALGKVSFKGASANATQKAYLPSDVSLFFESDRANAYYAYSDLREDAAMLFEEAMMSHRFNIQRDVAVTDNPEVKTGDTVIVNWGQRGRIAEPKIESRAAFVITQMMPELDAIALLQSLPSPIEMQAGKTWNENLAISPQVMRMFSPMQQQAASTQQSKPQLQLSGNRHIYPTAH